MASFGLAFIFIVELVLSLVLLWHWISVRDRLKKMDERLSESLDDHDLMDFQERISGLLKEVRETGQSMATQIEQRRAALDREIARARDAEKHLIHRTELFGKEQEKSRAKLEAWLASLEKKQISSKPVPEKKAVKNGKFSAKVLKALSPRPGLNLETPVPKNPAPQLPASSRYQKVYEMADQGLSKQEIGKACGYLAGEVELILNLRPRSKG